MLDVTTLLSGFVLGAGVIVWGVRQEGRLNGHDRLFEERKDQADERHDDIQERLVRIEDKQDAILERIARDRR